MSNAPEGTDGAAIVRVSEAHVIPDRVDAFLGALRDLVAALPERYPGLMAHEVLVDMSDRSRVTYTTWWADESTLIAYAGPEWAHAPVTFADEESYLTRPLTLRHFVRPS